MVVKLKITWALVAMVTAAWRVSGEALRASILTAAVALVNSLRLTELDESMT